MLERLDVYREFSLLPEHVDPGRDTLIRDSLSVATVFRYAMDGEELMRLELLQDLLECLDALEIFPRAAGA